MRMKRLLALALATALLAACSKSEDSAASSADSNLPGECNAYLDRVAACISKQGGATGAAMTQGLAQTKASWSALAADKAALSNACKIASDAFSAQATAMKC